MIRTVIIDDEPLARKGIQQLLATQADFEIIAECEDGLTALEKIDSLKPDLLFLDIQMPELDGFDVLSALQMDPLPLVIFVTAYDEYALQAFQNHAVDYLLKPIKEEYFLKAIQRVRFLLQAKNEPDYELRLQELLLHIQQRPDFIQRFLVRERNKLLIVPIEKVNVFEAEGDYVCLITSKDRYLVRLTLSGLEQKLDPALFVRINRSTIVRLRLIGELEPLSKGDYQLTLINGPKYTLSRTYREQVLKALQ